MRGAEAPNEGRAQMSTTAVIAHAFTPRPVPLRATESDAKRAEVIAWLHGRLDWEDRLVELHDQRAGSDEQEHLRSSACQPTSTRSSNAHSVATA